MLHLLPAEIALQVISCLPLQSLHSVILVSHAWNDLITINEPAVYRNAATLHRFVDGDRPRAGSIPEDWKTYCRRELQIERGWRGQAPSVVQELTATGTAVHRIKVDYELGLIITTHQTGGLSVCDIESNRVLWALSPDHVVRHAHCEYDQGYIVFNRYDKCKEVWRRTAGADRDPPPETSFPDKKMLDASARAAENYNLVGCHPGHFKPWALFHMPDQTRAFRFSYPTLLAASSNQAYVWDIPSSQLISVVEDIQQLRHSQQLGAIAYVEVNDLYVFICGSNTLRIFARQGGALLYQLSPRELSSAAWDVQLRGGRLASSIIHPQMLLHHHARSSYHGNFVACHVSATGDLAVLTSSGRLVIFPNFQCLFTQSNAVHHRDIAVVLNFQPFSSDEDISYYLAVDSQNSKFALATRNGIFVVSLEFRFSCVTAECPPEQDRVTVCRLSNFDNHHLLSLISCLQITHDAIYFTYRPSYANVASATANGGAGIHDPPDVEVFVGVDDDLEDGFVDGWEDEDSEDEDLEGMPVGEDEDPLHVLLHNWAMPGSVSTVYSVSF